MQESSLEKRKGGKWKEEGEKKIQGIYERKVSVLPWLKWIETENVHKLEDKEKHFVRT